MARNILSTRLNRISSLTSSIVELDLKMVEPNQLNYQAGQFMMLNIPPAEGQKRPTLRAYSMASDAKDPSGFKLIIRLLPKGVGSDFIRTFKNDDTVQFTGPFGKLLFLEPPTDQVIFLSTGAGISQHVSYLLTHGAKYPNVKFRMMVGVWTEDEVFYQNELENLKTSLRDFEYNFVIDKPSPTWKGLSGYVTNHLNKFDYKSTPTTFYLCGNPAMTNSVSETLKSQGFDSTRILAEAFY